MSAAPDRLRVIADITPVIDLNDPSPGLEMLSLAKSRFGQFLREPGSPPSFLLGIDLRLSRHSPDPRDTRRLVTVEALSTAGEAFLREWADRLEAYESRMQRQQDWKRDEFEEDDEA